jgi:anthranilate synthase/aminodeoxychorismate synthase-like glutamine amidotransferase
MTPLADGGRRYEPATPPGPGAPRVLVIDNYDSFTFNLVQYLLELGAIVDVFRNDALSAEDAVARGPTHVLLSPGPGRPADSGVCQDLCRLLAPGPPHGGGGGPIIPLLGVCLGHQTLCEVHGASVVRAERIMHGKTSPVHHDGTGILARVPSPFTATRYHSLIVQEPTLPAFLLPVARTQEGELMAVRHAERPVYGVQFHPESILSEHGHHLLGNFLAQHGGR